MLSVLVTHRARDPPIGAASGLPGMIWWVAQNR
jgi:hypothetical protein